MTSHSNVIQPAFVGIAGGSGSGKTTFALALQKALGTDRCGVLSQDHYYIDQSSRFTGDGESVNFDHPDALDWPLLHRHLLELREGHTIQVPIYDFATHKRLAETRPFEPKPVVILDGTLIFTQPQICKALDYRIFIQTDEKVRFERRLNRDVRERGRTPDGVKKQFELQVKPMHDQFVEPGARVSDVVLQGDESVYPFVDAWVKRLGY